MEQNTPSIDELLRGAADAARPVVRGVQESQFAEPTPCAEYDVRELLIHLLDVTIEFQKVAARESPALAGDPRLLDGDWRGTFDEESRRLAEAWAAPGALEGNSPGMGLPQTVLSQMILVDLTVHAWDLARATSQQFQPDPQTVDVTLPTCEQLAPTGREMGAFGPEVSVRDDAPPFDRLLGLLGRDPHWAPGV